MRPECCQRFDTIAVPVHMLRFLSVRNLAVIDRVEVEFEPGLTVLTGETGAGKSVLVEAIDLLVGGRASADLVRTGEDQASIQAIFERPDASEVIVRREISAAGRSRAFVDDVLATSAALRELGGALIDLHGQHEHQTLLDPAQHVDVLDVVAGHDDLIARVSELFDEWRSASAALERTRLDDREKRARIEMASFQLQDIETIAPQPGEDESLAGEKGVLTNIDRLSRWSAEAYTQLYDGDSAALHSLAAVWKRIAELATLDPRFTPYLDSRDEVTSRLDDLAFFLRSYASDLDASPERLQAVEDRLAAIERLKRKYGPTLADVLTRQQGLKQELAELGASDERAAALQAQEGEARQRFLRIAHDLSARRRHTARGFARALEADLAELAMPKSRIDVRITEVSAPESWSRRGVDEVELMFSPNPGEELRPLARIASGGELSRLMLAMRMLAAPDESGRTLIFDEVDAGIGGAAADAVGARLQSLGARYQVLCVTHLAQIAARADAHLQISKQVRGGRTHTVLTRLDDPGREAELGRMIAGEAVSARVLASARELLATRRVREHRPKGESESRPPAKAKGKRSGA
jgi:DNA repair protein RecN (Recombination protein N)